MIEARAGIPFEASISGASPGLTSVRVKVVRVPGGGTVVDWTAAPEVAGVPGTYATELTVPATETDTTLLLVWDRWNADDLTEVFTDELLLTGRTVTVQISEDGHVVLDPETVRVATASRMKYRLRVGGFAIGAGGVQVADFTDDTTPDLTTAIETTTRHAARVSNDYPYATDADEAELRTIAALRSAIELELSTDNPHIERVRLWQGLLTAEESRVEGSTTQPGDVGGESGHEVVFGFGGCADVRAPGSECPRDPGSCRRPEW